MKLRAKNILRGLAKHFGLKVKFVNYLSDEIHGKLLVREKRILINANKARCEHVFTLLHEIGHYALHFKKHARNRHRPWFLNLNVNNDFIAGLVSKLRRQIRFIYNKQSGKEWEADLWAMCALLYFSRSIGHSDLLAFVERHPEKSNIFWLAVCGSIYAGIKARVSLVCEKLIQPFRMIGKLPKLSWSNQAASIPRQPGLRLASVLVSSR